MVRGYACVCAHMLTLPHALTESQFDQSALSVLLLCFVIPGFLAMGWQFVKSWLDLASSVAKRAVSEEEGGSGLDVQRAEEGKRLPLALGTYYTARKAETESEVDATEATERGEARPPTSPEHRTSEMVEAFQVFLLGPDEEE